MVNMIYIDKALTRPVFHIIKYFDWGLTITQTKMSNFNTNTRFKYIKKNSKINFSIFWLRLQV